MVCLYVTSDDGILTVVETKTGEQVYKQRIGGNYSASPLLVGDRIYLTSEEGVVKVIQAGPEFQLLAENSMDERSLATPAVLKESLIIRTAEAALPHRINEAVPSFGRWSQAYIEPGFNTLSRDRSIAESVVDHRKRRTFQETVLRNRNWLPGNTDVRFPR